jgi:hypothetical protein
MTAKEENRTTKSNIGHSSFSRYIAFAMHLDIRLST